MTWKKTKFNRLAGFVGIASALLFIVSIVGMQAYLASNLKAPTAFTQNMIDLHFTMLIYGWSGLIATLLVILLIYAFYKTNESSIIVSRMVFLVTVIGLCFISVGYLFHLVQALINKD